MKPAYFGPKNNQMDHLFFSCDIMKMWWSEISIIVLKEVSSGYNNVARLWISTSKNDAINKINAAFTWTIWNSETICILAAVCGQVCKLFGYG
jgi:hypothetical protein